jgi:hypothetical protein
LSCADKHGAGVKRFVHIALRFAVLTGWSAQGATQGNEPISFAGKRTNVLIGFSAIGIGYDTYGRILARYLGRHQPGNPNVVPQNRPGAGSLTLAKTSRSSSNVLSHP